MSKANVVSPSDDRSGFDAVVMPCPRLELEWIKTGADWRKRECVYSLVLPLGEYDIRRESKDGEKARNETKAELGRTAVTGGNGQPPIWEDGKVETPFRDGAHSKFDAEALGGHIPRVAVCGDVFTILEA
ncbi:hypothetical protein NO559_07910 [Dasania sp. GY-MA-18]|uniref:Uncharacterized protein n=1 Tax=Dasania phycosphaerae TaxID=2950436 RepID=A0A9J6RLB5_9GAMM|nr:MULTISPECIES: hypothetical protein [Dasania]MCR8922691.1 hypothetical protein [Dasania sp. GY-MA-18]MCZ0865121.1 hypothetical protein [Dasania phycosphaerae]MCZ0868847.1 hypothetical protein [Dasania phycosphaerae]